jgi:hypothetical protein
MVQWLVAPLLMLNQGISFSCGKSGPLKLVEGNLQTKDFTAERNNGLEIGSVASNKSCTGVFSSGEIGGE